MRSLSQLVAATAITFVATPATAEQLPSKIAITPTSEKGAVIIRSPEMRPPGGYKTAYRLSLQAYDPTLQSMRGGAYGGQATIAAQPKLYAQGYLMVDIKPGTYVIRDFSQQDFWALCFNGASYQFTVKPGEVLYLGAFDAMTSGLELAQRTVRSGKVALRQGTIAHFFDDVPPPRIVGGTASDLPAVSAMMKLHMPKTTVAPTLASLQPAKFGTGRDLLGTSRICGGFYAKSAK